MLPRINLSEPRRFIGKSTVEAMRIGAVHGYRGMVRSLLHGVLQEMDVPDTFVCATGGHARLVCRSMTEVHAIDALITMRGLAAVYRFQEEHAS
jgi:type III pantothenate kinase